MVGSGPTFEPAPTITIHISSLNGNAELPALPDSGADISVAGKNILTHLGEHEDNLLPSTVTPRAVNGTRMHPVGELPVTLALGSHTYQEKVYIYPEVKGLLLSWKAAKGLHILPDSYPYPCNPLRLATTMVTPSGDFERDYPSIFNGQIEMMEG
jgi:hypothetical protein